MASSIRLADLLASVSLLSDAGFALPPEETIRTTIIATAVARRLGLSEPDVSDVFYTALLQHLGCIGYAHETAAVYGDERVVNAAAARVGDDLGDVIDTFVRAIARGRGPVDFARVTLFTLFAGDGFDRGFAATRCEVGRETARRLGLPDTVRRALYEVAESWDGRGRVAGLRGDDTSPAARIAVVAATAARFLAIGGPDAVRVVLGRRASRSLDPSIAATLTAHAADILGAAGEGDPHTTLLAIEPTPARTVRQIDLASVAEAIGDVADLKSTFTIGHSRGVAALVARAAAANGLDGPTTARLRLGAYLHDVGRVAIPTSIWERPGPLTRAEWEQVRLHPYHSERILSRSDALRPIAPIAGLHHERLDGSGYHRGAAGRAISPEARLLAAADAFHALTEARPHRPAWSAERAAEHLEAEALAGRLEGAAATAVVAAAGFSVSARISRPQPAGLSEREVKVLGLLARGLSNAQIGSRLEVSPRTAEHHVQNIYAKLGVSSRAAAALFAMEHDLLD
jgi:HD-GYP domain-containing protein (c-di-GMP phosphodiesterase class II)/DNA-binding CsgD family transcriptional regulator